MSDESSEYPHRRSIRSFVLRGGRLTEGQSRALDQLWPRFGIDEQAGELDFDALFGRVAPVVLEIGFGNGESTWQMAAAAPDENFIAVDVHRPGVGQLLTHLQKHGISNTRIYCGDGVEFLRDRIMGDTLAAIRLFFPDPWPKKRHHKRRIIQPEFIALVAEKVRGGGILHLATDWQPYADHMLEVLGNNDSFENLSPSGDYYSNPKWRPETRYERRGQKLGHEVRDLVYRRRS